MQPQNNSKARIPHGQKEQKDLRDCLQRAFFLFGLKPFGVIFLASSAFYYHKPVLPNPRLCDWVWDAFVFKKNWKDVQGLFTNDTTVQSYRQGGTDFFQSPCWATRNRPPHQRSPGVGGGMTQEAAKRGRSPGLRKTSELCSCEFLSLNWNRLLQRYESAQTGLQEFQITRN